VIAGVWWGDLIDRGHWENLGVDERKLLKFNVQEVGWGMDWMEMAQDRDRWRALVTILMSLRVPGNPGNLLTG
jgi:hypothetical protein